jgi:hypothetical protein
MRSKILVKSLKIYYFKMEWSELLLILLLLDKKKMFLCILIMRRMRSVLLMRKREIKSHASVPLTTDGRNTHRPASWSSPSTSTRAVTGRRAKASSPSIQVGASVRMSRAQASGRDVTCRGIKMDEVGYKSNRA